MSRRRIRTDRHERAKRRLTEILRGLAPRFGLGPAAVGLLVDRAQILFSERGETIFVPSETHDFSYVLIDGLVQLGCRDHRDHAITMQLVGPGRLFGVSWLPSRRRREVRAVAHTDVTAALITQQAIATVFADVADRTPAMSYSWRALSGLLVQQGEGRSLETPERVIHRLRALAHDHGTSTPGGTTIGIRLTCDDLAALVGAVATTIRRVVSELQREGRIARDGAGFFVLPGDGDGGHAPPAPTGPYFGVPAPAARATLGTLLGRCAHLGLTQRAMDLIYREAQLFDVPRGELLLPPGAAEMVAFVVRGSAWLEAAGASGVPFALELVSPGRFVRLPTGASSRGARMWGRAHQDCIVGLLSVGQMRDVIRLLSLDGTFTLLDATCRAFSRHLCDCTTAPTRATACRLLSTFAYLAHDFPGRSDAGVAVNVPLTHQDLARFVDVDQSAVCKAIAELTDGGWIAKAGPQHYVLLKAPRAADGTSGACALCAGTIGRRHRASSAPTFSLTPSASPE